MTDEYPKHYGKRQPNNDKPLRINGRGFYLYGNMTLVAQYPIAWNGRHVDNAITAPSVQYLRLRSKDEWRVNRVDDTGQAPKNRTQANFGGVEAKRRRIAHGTREQMQFGDATMPIREWFSEAIGLQTKENNLVVPALQAAIVATVADIIGAVAFWGLIEWRIGWRLLVLAWGFMFLYVFLNRVSFGDSLLTRHEEYELPVESEPAAPMRNIKTNWGNGVMPMPAKVENDPRNVTASEWRELATALIHHGANVSRDGIRHNCKLSKSRSGFLANELREMGWADGTNLYESGYRALIAHLPKDLDPSPTLTYLPDPKN